MAAFGLAASAAWLEGTGYSALDTPRGNILCDIDPSCRPLKESEIFLARTVFAEAIDYRRVKIFNRSNYVTGTVKKLLGLQSVAEAPNGNIYYIHDHLYADDIAALPYKQPVYLHEMTHVWQHQSGVNLLRAAATEYHRTAPDFSAAYAYDLTGKPFAFLGIEQQAEIVEDYQNLVNAFDEKKRQQHCGEILKYEAKIRATLPLTSFPACRMPSPKGNV